MVPAVYLGIIVIFIYLEFSGEDTFSSTISHLTIMGKISQNPWDGEDSIKDLQIFGTGIILSLDRSNPIRIYSTDGLVHKAEPIRYYTKEKSLVIEMTTDLTLTITEDESNPDTVVIGMNFPEYSSIKNVSIPFSMMRDFNLKIAGGIPVFSINNTKTGEVTMLSLPMGASVDSGNQKITIPSGENGLENILLERTDSTPDPLSFWFAQTADLLSQEEYDAFLDSYLAKAMEGWRNTRFNRESGTWEGPDGDAGFNERIAAALLAGSITTPGYNSLYEGIDTARENSSRELSLLSAPFLGNIMAINEERIKDEGKILLEITGQIKEKDLTVFRNRNLYSLINYHLEDGPDSELYRMASSAELEDLEIPTIIGLLEYILDYSVYEGSTEALIYKLDEITNKEILPIIRSYKEGFFLESNIQESDLLLSIRTGALFIRGARLLNKDILSVLGKELIYSALLFTDSQGIIPSVLHFDDGLILTSGNITPEKLYPLIVHNTYYPREHLVFTEEEKKTWIYSSSSEITAEKVGNTHRYTFEYAKDEIHYILIQGVEPFARLRLLGIIWNPDPIFQYYYSGWYYEERTRSLYIKVRNKNPVEEIILYYD